MFISDVLFHLLTYLYILSKPLRIGLPLYLETETEKNVSIYERFEFGTLKKVTLPVIDQPMWLMVREAGESE